MRIGLLGCILAVNLTIAARPCVALELQVTPALERCVERGLAYLADTQMEDGKWGSSSVAIVGMAMMSFLAHGELPDEGRYGHVIRRAVNYILSTQQGNGLFGRGSMYDHGFATLAIAEVYGQINDDRVGPALQRATGLIVRAQNALGGWRYSVGSTDADTTVSGAQMMGLRAAATAGIEVPLTTIQRGVAFYKNCFAPGGGFGYTGPGGAGQPCSAIGLLVLCLSGQYHSLEVKATADWFLTRGFGGRGYFYYKCYYASQAMYQAGGKYWKHWNTIMTPLLMSMQRADGSWGGITQMRDAPMNTAFALLSLEVNYNFLPIYQR